MTPPLENHHVCTACGQSYPVTALVCACGGREFVPVELETGGTSMRVTNYDGVPLFEARHVPQPGGTYSNTLSKPPSAEAMRESMRRLQEELDKPAALQPQRPLPVMSASLYFHLRGLGIIDASGNIDWSKLL